MTTIAVYSDTAEEIEMLADINDTTVAEIVDEMLDEYKTKNIAK